MKVIQYDPSKMKIIDGILIKYFSRESDIKIPKGVIGIAEDAFNEVNFAVEKISLPKTLLWIGSRAFKGCAKVHNIIFPDNLVEIADEAFAGCYGLDRLVFSKDLYRIGAGAFAECESLKSVVCHEGLVRIDANAFEGCRSLLEINLPASCTYIDENAFLGCTSLTICAPAGSDAEWFAKDSNLRFEKSSVKLSFEDWKAGCGIYETDFVIRNGVLAEYAGAEACIEIPDDVIIIGSEVFMQNLQLKSVVLPETLAVIGAGAFCECNSLNSINIASTFTYIGECAFSGCTRLNTAIMFCGGMVIGSKAFALCSSLTEVILPDKNVVVCRNAFEDCLSLSQIKLPVFDWDIDEKAFPELPTRTNIYLSCQNHDLAKLEINAPATVFPYAYDLQGYWAIHTYCNSRGLDIGAEEDIPKTISKYAVKYALDIDDENTQEHVDASKEKMAAPAIKNYKELIEINGIRELLDCDICLDDVIISNEQIARNFMKFVVETIRSKSHNAGIIAHSGSICFNAMLIAISSIEALLLNTATPTDIISTLVPGDPVLYVSATAQKASKYIFEKIDNDEKVYLKKNNSSKERLMLPKTSWYKISPYYRESTSTSDVGLRRFSSQKNAFYKRILKKEEEDIPKAPNASIVVLLPLAEAKRLWKSISLRYEGENYALSELVSAAYYTENGITYFAGNPGKTEPVIKFTDDIYRARELIEEKSGNKTVGALILSADYLDRSYSELTDIILDKRLGFTYCAIPVSRYEYPQLLKESDDISVFNCSPEYIDQYLDVEELEANDDSPVINELRTQLMTILHRRVSEEIAAGGVAEKDYYDLREEILSFKHTDYDLEEKDLFVMESLASLKILMSALFPVDTISSVLEKPTFGSRLEQLRKSAAALPKSDLPKVNSIIDTLVLLYYEMGDTPGKQNQFREIIQRYSDGKIALIVPKAYYAQVLYSYNELYKSLIDQGHLIISTATRFDTSQNYDAVIFISNTFGKGFAPQRCYASQNVIALLYECEKRLYSFSTKQLKVMQAELNSRSFYSISQKEDVFEQDDTEQIISDEELDEYIDKVSNDYLLRPIEQRTWGNTTSEAEIAAIVSFDTGERAFLTKYYTPYVLDEANSEIRSPEVSKLRTGDVLVFNTDYFGTRDIVDFILQIELESQHTNDSLKEAYKFSQHWKQVLRDYMKATGKSAREIAQELKKQGITVEIPTILGWIGEDSHTVGPRDPAAFQQIGYLVNDQDMFYNPDRYVRACSNVRSKRGLILKGIARAMLSFLSGANDSDTVPEDLRDIVGRLAKTYRIETIRNVKRMVPVGITNHPIDDIEM